MQKKKIERIAPTRSVGESIVYHALTAGPEALRIVRALSKYDIKDSSGDGVLLHLLRSGALTFTDAVDILPPAVFMEKNSGGIPLLGRMLELSLVTEPEKLFLSSMNDVLFDLSRKDADGRSLASRFRIGDGTLGAEMFRKIASESENLLVEKMKSSHREKCSEPSETAERIARTFRAACGTFDAKSSWGIVGAACLYAVSSVADKTGESPSTETIKVVLDDAYRNLDAGMKKIPVPGRAEAVLDARRAGSEALVALSSMRLNEIASKIIGRVVLEFLKHVDVRDMVGDSAALHLVASGKIHSSALCLDDELFDVLMSKNNTGDDTLLHRLLEMNLIDKETTIFIAELLAPYDNDLLLTKNSSGETVASMMSMNRKHMPLEAALRALEGKQTTYDNAKEGVFDGRR